MGDCEAKRSEYTDKVIKQTTAVGVFGNVVLAGFKLIAGFVGHSTAMVSDAVHSLSDVLATFIAFVGLKMSQKQADRDHPYGHERLECLASILLAIILMITGGEIGYGCIQDIYTKNYVDAAPPGMIALVAAIVSIVTKESMFWYTLAQAKKINSSVFKADAWHHRSDALSSIGALIGIGGARMGFPIMDSLAGIVICIVIEFVGIGILKDAIDKLVDKAASPEYEDRIREAIDRFAKDKNIDMGTDCLITRTFGDKVYVDLEISLDGNMNLKDAHDIGEELHDYLEEEFEEVKHVMIHTNPAGFNYEIRK